MNAPDPSAVSARTSTVTGADGALAVYEAKGAEIGRASCRERV